MKIGRRQFFEKSGHGAVGTALLVAMGTTGTFLLGGCSVEDAIKAWVPVGTTAFNSVLTLLQGAGIIVPGAGQISAIVTLIKVGLADLLAAVDEYKNAPAANKATFAGKVSTLLSVLNDNFAKFWGDLSLPGGSLVQLVTGVAGIIMAAIAGFAAQLPAPVVLASTFRVAGVQQTIITPKRMSLASFKKQFNTVVVANGHSEMVLN
jgi:hypothetical protein